jgi:hypothetical protein
MTKVPVLLISTANKHDRFKLLDSPSIPVPDIDNDIHPLFQASNFANTNSDTYRELKHTLQLASLFLKYDSVLEWFIAPLLGLPLIESKSKKIYLSDPLANKSRRGRKILIQKVREALDCLSHSIKFRFVSSDVKYFARTTIQTDRSYSHGPKCPQYAKPRMGVLIEMRGQYQDFLQKFSTSCPTATRLRHDFSLAVTMFHEIAHAVGVMRRGHLREPYIRLDHPKAEFGYAWENFMFGGVINPFDRASSEIGFLMRKMWTDDSKLTNGGVREWGSVPIAYIAQWFQRRTWQIIEKRGPSAIPPPISHLKLRSYPGQSYVLLSDSLQALEDVRALQSGLVECYKPRYPASVVLLLETKLKLMTPERVQEYVSAQPVRISKWTPRRPSVSVNAKLVSVLGDSQTRSCSSLLPAARKRRESGNNLELPRKRPADNGRESSTEPSQRPVKKRRNG